MSTSITIHLEGLAVKSVETDNALSPVAAWPFPAPDPAPASDPANPAVPAPAVTEADIVRAIRSDPGCSKRSARAIRQYLPGCAPGAVDDMIENMTSLGQLVEDCINDVHYYSVSPTWVQPGNAASAEVSQADSVRALPQQPARPVTEWDITRAIRSDPRFTARSLNAIQEALTECDRDDVSKMVGRMVAVGILGARYSSYLGASLYSVTQ